ncbi:MAG: hypothetical protein LBS45_12235 [Synergistaceae bacterium]|jgi:hypothetical protein|nr:hypothetical protein [Synergistaceae bacterium]
MNTDIFETGTPKYSTAQSIYDALEELCQTQEQGVLEEMGFDVSFEGQTFYYTEKGDILKDRFDTLSNCGDKMWLLDLACAKLDSQDIDSPFEIHDTILECLTNTDLAKRLDFKKFFIDRILSGRDWLYSEELIEELYNELHELDWVDNLSMCRAFYNALERRGALAQRGVYVYPQLASGVLQKVRGLRLEAETQLIAECRALLSSYDDFILGLRSNQALFDYQKQRFGEKLAMLQEAYDQRVRLLLAVAEEYGIAGRVAELVGATAPLMIEGGQTDGK